MHIYIYIYIYIYGWREREHGKVGKITSKIKFCFIFIVAKLTGMLRIPVVVHNKLQILTAQNLKKTMCIQEILEHS